MSDDGLHPSEGARFLLERTGDAGAESADRARYRAAVYTPEARYDYDAALGTDGSCDVTASAAPAPDDLDAKLRQIARVIAKGARAKLRDGLPPWPQRVLRWRGPNR
jgi:hypothetical protein